ncbi:hypothetical protein JSQ81_00390 [Sporosarcina sp. Marseille-Q4063]|uniref:hypothetical protein n=1 Tax=Sporosarcina sp. Marseille-Q4063 TaxID=2810514 RepID=UPI001BB0CDE2|nr:hypothetical protein [Sporosarcina sp. Marseille-Q4063]QUW22086.1 hypothetical protein JSQ81_00390 [Sporosarcina sp. Marseille-Q4063]
MTNKWDDEKIQKLLNDLPDVQDTRSKEDVLSRLKQDKRLQKRPKQMPSRNTRRNLIPAFVAAAVLLALTLLIPSMLQNNSSNSNDKASMKIMSKDDNENMQVFSSEDSSIGGESEEMAESEMDQGNEVSNGIGDENTSSHSTVYPNDAAGYTVFHLGLASEAAASIPVTFLIPDSQIKEDFGDIEPSSLDLYMKYAGQIDEEALGFDDYHPYKGTFSVDGDVLVQSLPTGHGYDIAPGTISTYLGSLQDTFFGFEEIRFENEDGTAVEFDQVGEPSKPMKLNSGVNHYNYYLFEQSDGQEYLSSNFSYSYENLETALEEMKINPNDIYSSIIPTNVEFEVVEKNEVTVVKFKGTLDLLSMSEIEANQLIDGIVLTAASFDRQIQFENISQVEWNGFNLNEPLPIPVGPNVLPFLLK